MVVYEYETKKYKFAHVQIPSHVNKRLAQWILPSVHCDHRLSIKRKRQKKKTITRNPTKFIWRSMSSVQYESANWVTYHRQHHCSDCRRQNLCELLACCTCLCGWTSIRHSWIWLTRRQCRQCICLRSRWLCGCTIITHPRIISSIPRLSYGTHLCISLDHAL